MRWNSPVFFTFIWCLEKHWALIIPKVEEKKTEIASDCLELKGVECELKMVMHLPVVRRLNRVGWRAGVQLSAHFHGCWGTIQGRSSYHCQPVGEVRLFFSIQLSELQLIIYILLAGKQRIRELAQGFIAGNMRRSWNSHQDGLLLRGMAFSRVSS